MKNVIVSMTTVPSRQKRLLENLDSILNQSYKPTKLVINIDDNLSQWDYEFYEDLKQKDDIIEICICDAKWRSCNKLLPTLKRYPEDIIITVDDDIYYPVDCIAQLMKQYEMTPDCVIAHEVNPIIINDGKFAGYANDLDVKLGQRAFGKYLSNCCLFPPHIFDGSDLFDYDKMMECTNGDHDELWFWINSTINGVNVINLDYVLTFEDDVVSKWTEGEYRLHDINISQDKTDWYNNKVVEVYGDRINEQLNKHLVKFVITKDNFYSFIYQFPRIVRYYNYQISIDMNNLTSRYRCILIDFINKHKNG